MHSKEATEPPEVEVERNADYDQTWGAMPIIGIGGDELQLPPVPMQAGPFAPIVGTSEENGGEDSEHLQPCLPPFDCNAFQRRCPDINPEKDAPAWRLPTERFGMADSHGH